MLLVIIAVQQVIKHASVAVIKYFQAALFKLIAADDNFYSLLFNIFCFLCIQTNIMEVQVHS
jgi:hypothetical protein